MSTFWLLKTALMLVNLDMEAEGNMRQLDDHARADPVQEAG
jgi:hypothetical protein